MIDSGFLPWPTPRKVNVLHIHQHSLSAYAEQSVFMLRWTFPLQVFSCVNWGRGHRKIRNCSFRQFCRNAFVAGVRCFVWALDKVFVWIWSLCGPATAWLWRSLNRHQRHVHHGTWMSFLDKSMPCSLEVDKHAIKQWRLIDLANGEWPTRMHCISLMDFDSVLFGFLSLQVFSSPGFFFDHQIYDEGSSAKERNSIDLAC